MITFQDKVDNPRVVAVYTTLKILVHMRRHMGIEAANEFADKYIEAIEGVNPFIAELVSEALIGQAAQNLFVSTRAKPKGGEG
jgi:hypothetical protein